MGLYMGLFVFSTVLIAGMGVDLVTSISSVAAT
ncbi:MAG: TrkH family potassium uptake protein, partial [Deltaproteobacteria bacterium]|nr:TrkH family potassium uptake protein [Deltaproteobacteria bacterium]